MSLLAELLSHVKGTLGSKKDVPPHLKEIIQQTRERNFSSRHLILLGLVLVGSVAAGYWTVTFMKEKSGEIKSQQALHQPPPTAKEKIVSPSVTENQTNEKPLTQNEDFETGSFDRPEELTHENRKGAQSFASRQQAENHLPIHRDQQTRRPDQRELDTGEAASYIYTAMQYEEQMKYSDALTEYRKALNYKPESSYILNNISYLYLRMELHESALEFAEKALGIDDSYVPAMVNAALSLAGLNRYEKAEHHLKNALASEPHNRNALYNLGLLYENQKKYDDALTMYQNLVKAGNYDAHLHMARVFELSGREDEAMSLYREMLHSSLASEDVKAAAKKRLGMMMQR